MNIFKTKHSFLVYILVSFILINFNVGISAQRKESVAKYIDNYNKLTINQKEEKLYIHFDRPAYYSGDEVWFKAYLLMAANYQKDLTEKILYLELRDLKDSLLIKRNYKINKGTVNGIFYLPDSLLTGQYYFLSYTNWMKNDFGGSFFKRNIYIFNDQYSSSISSNADLKSINGIKHLNQETHTQFKKEKKPKQQKLILKFYPEGGTFVNDLTNVVAFEAIDETGTPLNVHGTIKDDAGNFITFFRTFNNGKGFFMIKPVEGRSYKAYIDTSDVTLKPFPLPEATQFGYTLNVSNIFSEDSLTVKIQSRTPELKESEHFYLLGLQNGIIKMAVQGGVGKKVFNIKCHKNLFNNGIVTFTLLDANMIPRCERLVFINSHDPLQVNVSIEDTLFNKNKQVKVLLDIKDKNGFPVTGDFSLSVTDAGIISDSLYDTRNIISYLYLDRNFPKIKQYAKSILNKNDVDSHTLAELLMLTNGWRKFIWHKVDDDYKFQPEYEIETNNWIKGTVKRVSKKRKSVSGVTVTAMLMGEYHDFYSIKTNKDGQFLFSLLDFSDTVDVSIQTTSRLNIKSNYILDFKTNLPVLKNKKNNTQFIKLSNPELSIPHETDKTTPTKITLPPIHHLNAEPDFDDEMAFLEDTSSILLQEVEIEAEKNKTPKEKITELYGSPGSIINDKQIEAIRKQYPWKYSLFEMLNDVLPELIIEVNTTNIDNYMFSSREDEMADSISQENLALGYDEPDNSGEFSTYRIPEDLMKIFLKKTGGQLIYIYVDGEYIASTNDKGDLTYMRFPYLFNDLIDIDPNSVKSVELITDLKDINKEKIKDDNFIEYVRSRGKAAIISIYTKDGNGIFSDSRNKGLQNMKMLGFVREKVFYTEAHSDSVPAHKKPDNRVTLYWSPDIKLDSTGHAELSFYNSDNARSLRIDLEGISGNGIPGAKRVVFGKHVKPTDQKTTTSEKQKKTPSLSAGSFSNDLWLAYKNELQDKDMVMCIVLDSLGKPVPFADVFIKKVNLETTANKSGIFAFYSKTLTDLNDTVFISDPGKGYLVTNVANLHRNNGILKIHPAGISPENIQARSLMSDVMKKIKKGNPLRQSFDGIYRETITRDGFIYLLTDYALNLEQYSYSRLDKPHISHIEAGRQFRTPNFRQIIKFKPLSPLNNEVVQLRDPLLDNLPFLSPQYKKSLDVKVEGSTFFRGEKVYKVSFKQLSNTAYNLFDGFLLVDSKTHNVLYIYRKTSAAAAKFQSGSLYLESTNQYSEINFLDNEFRNSYKIVDGHSKPLFQYSCVKLEADGIPISFTREFLAYGDIKNGNKGRKEMPLDKMKQKTIMVKHVVYKPSFWRNGIYLLPDFQMFDNKKYLHEITYFKK